ncbi:molecular chaperone [Parashewanella spongiae]|uniref:Molecular chaperone n=1 Tax=Parashewanella spongiae TaxID=342950 RepID=A0A3A6TP03_9GAMM|nr:molecular chaperone [Parashewanella spongiae]MCL1079429.1 molecular chaperone [Parashewanella spongiae]RJY13197.1 molecular chaperone [Parashewanella spongiae]
MFIGFDYGSANCSVGVMTEDKVEMLPLGDNSHYMMSTLYAMDKALIAEAVYQNIPVEQKNDYAKKRSAQLSQARQARYELDLLPSEQAVFIGKAAFDAYMEMPEEGFYVRSPKSFLGATGLQVSQMALFEDIVTLMMQEVKQKAQTQLGRKITHAVIGRPVNFQAIGGEESNKQAESILRIAAKRAGFADIAFLFEPLAAGMDFEATLNKEQMVLVVDVGGGTTDCSMVRMNPERMEQLDRKADCLGHSGQRVGGNDLDIALAMNGFMPEFGLGSNLVTGRPMPQQVFWNAVAVNDINAQREFASLATKTLLTELKQDSVAPEMLSRLQTVQQQQLSYQVVKTAESTKIALSDQAQLSVKLPFVDGQLAIDLTQTDFKQAIEFPIARVEALMQQAVEQAGVLPEVIYVTGGTARSPAIYEKISQVYPNVEVVVGDHFGSVTAGLARWSQRLFSSHVDK